MPWWAIVLIGYFSTACAVVVWFTIIDRLDEAFKEIDGRSDEYEFVGVGNYILMYTAVFFLWPFAIKDFIDESKELVIEARGERVEEGEK